jgi:hypothetical protein
MTMIQKTDLLRDAPKLSVFAPLALVKSSGEIGAGTDAILHFLIIMNEFFGSSWI